MEISKSLEISTSNAFQIFYQYISNSYDASTNDIRFAQCPSNIIEHKTGMKKRQLCCHLNEDGRICWDNYLITMTIIDDIGNVDTGKITEQDWRYSALHHGTFSK